MSAAPVGEDKARKLPVLLQYIGQEPFVFTGEVAVHAVVGAHDRGGMSLGDTDFECQKIAFASGALADADVDCVAPALLVVECVVFDVADDELRLGAFDQFRHQGSGQDRVFAEVLEGAPVARFSGEIRAAAEGHVVALGAQFAADEGAVLVGGIDVPTGRGGHVGGQRSGVAAVHAAGAHAVGRVAHVDPGNAQAGNAYVVAHAAIGRRVL